MAIKTRAGLPTYNYNHLKNEEKHIYRRLVLFIGIATVILLIVWFWGITFIQIIGALGSRGDDGAKDTAFQAPLIKPVVSSLPEFTNKEMISVTGFTSSETMVTLFVNGNEIGTTTTNDSGNFTFGETALKEGLNFIKVIAKDDFGESEEEKVLITLDKKAPKLKITEPKDGQVIKKTASVTIKGATEEGAKVLINSIQATLNGDSFTYILGVSPGENEIEIKATDKAGNTEKVTLTITVKD